MRATQNARSKMAEVMPDVGRKLQDWTAAANAIDIGSSLVSLYHQLAIFSPPHKAVAAQQTANAIWRGRGFQLNADVYMHRQALLASLPMTLSEKFHKDLAKMRRVSRKTMANAIHLAPLIAEWRGTRTPALVFGGRRGQLMTLDIFDNDLGNYNFAIIGAPGSGKSVLMNEMAWSYRAIDAKVWMLDLGRSFEKLCRKAKGTYIEFKPDVDIIASDSREARELASRLNTTAARTARADASLTDRASYSERMSSAYERGEIISIDIAQDPHNLAMFTRYAEQYGGDSAAARALMEAELARQSMKPNRAFTDGAGIPVTLDEVRQVHTRQAGTVGRATDVDARRQAGDGEVAGFKREPQPREPSPVEPSRIRGAVQSRGADVRAEVEARQSGFDQKAEIVKSEDGTLESRRSLLKQSGKQAGRDAVSSLENAKEAVQDLLKKR